MPSLTVRSATPADVDTILHFIRSLAAFEREPDAVKTTPADLLRDGFGERPKFETLIAELDGDAGRLCAVLPHLLDLGGHGRHPSRRHLCRRGGTPARRRQTADAAPGGHRGRAGLCAPGTSGSGLEPGSGFLPAPRSGAHAGVAAVPGRRTSPASAGRRSRPAMRSSCPAFAVSGRAEAQSSPAQEWLRRSGSVPGRQGRSHSAGATHVRHASRHPQPHRARIWRPQQDRPCGSLPL